MLQLSFLWRVELVTFLNLDTQISSDSSSKIRQLNDFLIYVWALEIMPAKGHVPKSFDDHALQLNFQRLPTSVEIN